MVIKGPKINALRMVPALKPASAVSSRWPSTVCHNTAPILATLDQSTPAQRTHMLGDLTWRLRGIATVIDAPVLERRAAAFRCLDFTLCLITGGMDLSAEQVGEVWDHTARLAGYGGLEIFCMRTLGYGGSRILPDIMRTHDLAETAAICPDSSSSIKAYVGERAPIIVSALPAHVDDPKARDAYAQAMADMEHYQPGWRGRLMVEDYYRPDGPASYRLGFKPAPSRETVLARWIQEGATDYFPELNISPDMDEHTVTTRLNEFLQRYYRAEKIFWDGGDDNVHCDASASRLVQMLMAKGFQASTIGCHHFAQHGEPVQIVGAFIAVVAQDMNSPLHDAWSVISTIQSLGLDAESAESLPESLRPAFELYRRRTPAVAQAMNQDLGGYGHTIATVMIAGRPYIIDINQQQFGAAFEWPLLAPADEAANHGILLASRLADLPEAIAQIPFNELRLAFMRNRNAEQRVIRHYMALQASGEMPDAIIPTQTESRAGAR
jgi:hypothetical protein